MAKEVLNKKEEVDELSLDSTFEESPEGEESYSSYKVRTGIGKFWPEEVGKPNNMRALTGLDKSLPMDLNFTPKGEVLCRKSKLLTNDPDNTPCKYCEQTTSYKDKNGNPKKNSPYKAVGIVQYVLDNVGKVKPVKDKDGNPKKDDSGKPLTYDCNPIAAVALKRGKNDANVTKLKDIDRAGEFLNELFQLTKYHKDLKKTMDLTVASKGAEKGKYKHLTDGIDVPKDILERFEEMSASEVRGLIVNCYVDEGDWDNPILLSKVTKPSEDPKFAKSNEKDADKDLNG